MSSFSAKNATRSAVIAVFPSKSVAIIAQTAYLKCPAQVYAQRKTGPRQPLLARSRVSHPHGILPLCRCARNCFMCPNCRNTLSIVPSDPPDADDGRSLVANLSVIGEPPFFLYCNYCRWDSAEVDITFEKPTGLAGELFSRLLFFSQASLFSRPSATAQLQKFEDSAPESLEFERLKEHFEPFLRASSSSGHPPTAHSHPTPVNPITAAASSALSRDVSGVGKYTPAPRARREKGARDEISEYRTRVEAGSAKDTTNVDFMRRLEEVSQVAALGQRWANSWTTTLRTRYASFWTIRMCAFICRAQRTEAPANTSAFQKDEALFDMSSYPHQA